MKRILAMVATWTVATVLVVGCKPATTQTPPTEQSGSQAAPSSTTTPEAASAPSAESSQPAGDRQPASGDSAQTSGGSATGVLRSMGSALMKAATDTGSQSQQ